ncbi:MAG: hypothetical protein VKK04_02705, partial [Synechococcales bacterium]|nr:hypothetical protein [Synechococcales bacterium]
TTEGAKPELNTRGIYGQGFYMGAAKEIGESYASSAMQTRLTTPEVGVMSGRVKAKNPFIVTSKEIDQIGSNFPGDQSNNVDSEALTQFIKAKGYDSILVKDLGYIAALDGRQVVIYEDERIQRGSDRAKQLIEATSLLTTKPSETDSVKKTKYGNDLMNLPSTK